MKITTLTLNENSGWPELGTDALASGLNVFHGPSSSGKTTLADLATHVIYGRRFVAPADGEQTASPAGEVIVESCGRSFRLRRSHNEAAGERLTVAAVDRSAVDQETVQRLVAGLSPALLRPLCAVSFAAAPRLDWLLSPEFSHEFRAALWRLKWSPPTVDANLRPIYARLQRLETKMSTLVRQHHSAADRAEADVRSYARTKKRRASHFLSQLTNGELVRLRLGDSSGTAYVVTGNGNAIAVEALWSTQRDQVYLSLCMALVSALGRHGARLPLVLDEPFARLDAKSSAALVDVLEAFAARGHQVLVFTANREAAERCATLQASMFEMQSLSGPRAAETSPPTEAAIAAPTRRIRRRVKSTRMKHREAG